VHHFTREEEAVGLFLELLRKKRSRIQTESHPRQEISRAIGDASSLRNGYRVSMIMDSEGKF